MEGKNTEGGTQEYRRRDTGGERNEASIGTEKVNVEGKNTEGGTQEKGMRLA